MSVNSKLFVGTPVTNLSNVMQKVIKNLNVWQRSLLDKEVERLGFNSRMQLTHSDNYNWTNGVNVQTYDFNSFSIYFSIGKTEEYLLLILVQTIIPMYITVKKLFLMLMFGDNIMKLC